MFLNGFSIGNAWEATYLPRWWLLLKCFLLHHLQDLASFTMNNFFVVRQSYHHIVIKEIATTNSTCPCYSIPYNGNHPRKKSFVNFANLEAFANVFLHFLSRPEFLYMRLPELQKFSHELRQRRQFAKLFFHE